MPSHSDRTPSGVDLSRPTESTRRALYDLVVRIHFTPTPEEIQMAKEDPGNHWIPDYGPDAAELTVWYDRGRWYASWLSLEEEPDPRAPWRLWSVVRIVEDADPSNPAGVAFLEV